MSQEQNKDRSQFFYRASAADFMKIPGSPVAYWLNPSITRSFTSAKLLGDLMPVRGGMTTADNDKFVRLWTEVDRKKIGEEFWAPYNKGGEYRKWYGNHNWVVYWLNHGESIKSTGKASVRSEEMYFKRMIGWTDITSFSQLGVRSYPEGFIFDASGPSLFPKTEAEHGKSLGFLASKVASIILNALNPTLHVQAGNIASLPIIETPETDAVSTSVIELIKKSRDDWDIYETSWNFNSMPLVTESGSQPSIANAYTDTRYRWLEATNRTSFLEENNNRIFIEAYGLQDELTPKVPLNEITLTCNPHYRYGGNRSEEELETLLQCDTLRELVSYAIGCMMGRYSLDKPGLILASQGETLQDYLRQIPSPRFAPDDDAILPLTDQEWFADDATNRFREFIRVVWGEEHLQQNLDFVAESLCLHAIKPKKGEASLDTIRRYLSSQFFKDHLRTYKKRPIYWLFSSGKHKAFECLVYLHRYNEGTLARMRTEYVIPLTAKLSTYAAKLERDVEASTSTAEKKSLEKELTTLHNQQAELATFDEKLRHHADQRISLDLDDGVKVNYGKFGDLLAEVKAVTGDKAE